eukprot:c12315_g1_i1 orf=493-4239(+)
MKCFLLEMDISQEENEKYAARILPDISFASTARAKVQKPAVNAGHMPFDPSFTSSKHMGHRKVKFMCSSAGKILPRPSDMKLRYVGGETRMVSVPRYVQYSAFLGKMVELYGPDIALKYQLPEEDLDALVSVSSDEDFENMMEECDRLNAGEGSSKLRVFVFPASEVDAHDLDDLANFKSSERKFVDAINASPADFLPGMHSGSTAAKTYTNSDSFNDAYKAWNGIHSQDKDSLFLKNPYAEILQLENHIPTGNLHTFENFMPNQVSRPRSPFSHSAFMGQPTFSDTFVAADALENDSDHVGLEGSSSFFRQDLSHKYAENQWAASLEMHVQRELTSDDRGEDKTYRAEQSLAGQSSHMPIQNVLTSNDRGMDKIYRADQSSVAEHSMKHFGVEASFNRIESADSSPHSDSHLHGDPLILSPGAFLQKQLLSSSPGALLQQQIQPDWSSGKFLDADNMQPLPVSSGLKEQQQAFCEQHALQDHWERLPVYDSSFALDEENQASELMNDHSLGVQAPTTAEVPLHSKESSAAVFPASSAPSSPPGRKMQVDRRFDTVLQHIDSHEAFTTGFLLPDSTIPLDLSAQASTTIFPMAKMTREKVQMNMTSIPGQTLTQDFSRDHPIAWSATDTECYPFSSSLGISQEGMVNRVPVMRESSNLFSDAPSMCSSSIQRTREFSGLQNDEDRKGFLPSVKRGHSPGLSLSEETLVSGQSNTDGTQQHENEHVKALNESSPPGVTDNLHTSDMLSDLLESCRLTECLAAPSSTAESFMSRSACSLDEEPNWQEGDKLAASESLFAAIEGLDLPLSTHENSQYSSFQTMKNSLPSMEQFERVVTSPYPFNNGTSLFAEENVTRNREDRTITISHPAQVPALTSLIETWEASLLQDEDEQHTMMQHHVTHERAQGEINLSPTFDKEAALEDSRAEFEEMDEFASFDYEPTNAAAIAEQEAKARGLQMIRNCDLEELRELGSGTFGTVYHGKWRGTDVAIKRIKASCFTGRQAERDRLVADFWREAYILGQLHHPNVVAFYGVVPDGPGGTLATVTEYMVNGSLKQVLQNKDRALDRRKRLLIAMDAAFGMEYLHGKNVVHFDIKCENLLVNLRDTQRPICKVGDLGLSKVKQQTFVSGGVRGTLPWMAPELLNGSSSLVSEKVDVFSFGIVMWELLTGEEPYANMHYGAIIGGIVNNTLRPTVPRWCDPAWRSLMEKCWAADPEERPTFLEIANTLRAMEALHAAKGQGQARILEMYQ